MLHLVGNVLEERHGVEGGEARLPAVLGVEGRHAHQPVHPALGRQQAVGEAAADDEGGRQQARLLPGRGLVDLDGEAAALGPPLVHAQQHLGPVLGVGATGAGVDLAHGVAVVVLAGEERLELELRPASGRGRPPTRTAPWPAPRRAAPAAAASSTSSRSTRASPRSASRASKRSTSSVTRPSSVVTVRAWSGSSHRSGRAASASSSARRARSPSILRYCSGVVEARRQRGEVGGAAGVGSAVGLAGTRPLRRRHGRA